MLHGEIQFVKLMENAEVPKQHRRGDAGYDLVVTEEVTIKGHQWQDVRTGIAVKLPPGIWGRITNRSSTFRKRGLQVIDGVIDNDYTGELYISIYNPGSNWITVKEGERLAQLIPQELSNMLWREVDELPSTDRGSQGFGSTGK